MPRLVAITRTPSRTIWNMSRSPVTTITSMPCSLARSVSVAITAVGLVLLVGLLAARHARVPHHERGLRPVLGEDLHQHRREAEQRVGGEPARGGDGLREREEGPVGQAVAVDQEELGGALLR